MAGPAKRSGSSFNFGIVRGGISVNAIPAQASMEVDLRSIVAGNLDALEHQLSRTVSAAARASGVEFQIERTGERPLGVTPSTSALVEAAVETTRRFGVEPQLEVGSTDANIPMSMGIPAIALGGGGASGNVHTLDEWFDPSGRDLGIQRLVALIAVRAGLE